jgi:hypothetical protein
VYVVVTSTGRRASLWKLHLAFKEDTGGVPKTLQGRLSEKFEHQKMNTYHSSGP